MAVAGAKDERERESRCSGRERELRRTQRLVDDDVGQEEDDQDPVTAALEQLDDLGGVAALLLLAGGCEYCGRGGCGSARRLLWFIRHRSPREGMITHPAG